MIRRMLRPVFKVMPPVWGVAIFLFCYSVVWGVAEVIRVALSSLPPGELASILQPFLILETNTATFAAGLLAFWRVYAFHPITNFEYRQWLKRTPWTHERGLPMGSVLPGAVDLILVALLSWMAGGFWWFSPLMPLVGYVVVLLGLTCAILGFTHQRAILYSVLFALGSAIRLAGNPVFAIGILLAALPLILLGLRRSLEPNRWPEYALSLRTLNEGQKRSSRELGWPFGLMGPKPASRLICWPDTLAVALLVGWFLHALMSHVTFSETQDRDIAEFGILIAFIIAVARAVGYTLIYGAPITFFARILTGHWIIPRYDRVFLAPLLAMAAAYVAESLVERLAIPAAIGQPVVAALFAFMLISIGPSFRNWQLTGGHRINPTIYSSNAGTYLKV